MLLINMINCFLIILIKGVIRMNINWEFWEKSKFSQVFFVY